MPPDYSTFKIPTFLKSETYDFGVNEKSLAIYQELKAIAEEIEACRLRNS